MLSLKATARPFRKLEDDVLSISLELVLLAVFLSGLLAKVHEVSTTVFITDGVLQSDVEPHAFECGV